MGTLLWASLVLIVIVAWLSSIVVAFRKLRPRAGAAGVAAPFFLFGVFAWGLGSCLGGSGDCSTENTVTYGAVVVALQMLGWVVAAALLPKPLMDNKPREEDGSPASRAPSRFDRAVAMLGLAVAAAGIAIGVLFATPAAGYPSLGNLLAAGFAVSCAGYLVFVTVRHRRYPRGRDRWWLIVGWAVVAVALTYSALTLDRLWSDASEYFVSAMAVIGRSAPFVAGALAASCVGLFSEYRSRKDETTPSARPLPTPNV